MIPTSHALLICVIFLCGLEETVLSQRGHCTGNRCYTLFQVPGDFPGAQKACKDCGGQVLFSLDHIEKTLGGIGGSYWLATGGAAADHQNCSFISVKKGGDFTLLDAPCSEKLDGFLCEFTFNALCTVLQAGGGAKVKYATNVSSDVNEWETFPPGTIAVAEKVGGEYPESRHVCFSSTWIPAPWSCDVMRGGCDHNCSSATQACVCPAGQTLHPNRISCTSDPCAECAHECDREGNTHACKCRPGYALARDGVSCVDVDECKVENPCTGVGEECENTQGSFQCRCKDGFDEQDGVCEDFSNCFDCEHVLCEKTNGVYRCACRTGFRVKASDPTKCELYCTERDCPAECVRTSSDKNETVLDCYCLDGYIRDIKDNTPFCTDIDECEMERQCDHKCENLFGSYRCLCDEGFQLQGDLCMPFEDVLDSDSGSGSTPTHPTPASFRPSSSVPSYIKTGSVLGIAVFMALCAALVYFLLRNATKRCGKFELSSLKNPDIFYLQQVSTETYKRLSVDKQFRNDAQIL